MAPENEPAWHLLTIVSLLLVMKLAFMSGYTQILRALRGRKWPTPEDFGVYGGNPGELTDDAIERVRRAHQNDLENILPFFVVAVVYVSGDPSFTAVVVCLVGFLAARVLHTIFYLRAKAPHRSLAYIAGAAITAFMVVSALTGALESHGPGS